MKLAMPVSLSPTLSNPLLNPPMGEEAIVPSPLGGKVRMRAFLGEGANDSLREFHVKGFKA